ncbi:MAG: hypothetical protein JSV17_13725 [Candidatus Aminicenantes bacterium]|nr:MAG: hypothetical protein JSV17_13725 [Candidatus Aminicenantes bacterium]
MKHRLIYLGLILVIFGGFQGYTNREYYTDDAYIVLTVAKNAATGQGWAFNKGERINSSTYALNTFVAIIAHWLFPSHVTDFMHVVSNLALLAMALMLLHFLSKRVGSLAGFVCGLLFLIDPVIRQSFGMETPLFLALAVASTISFDRDSKFTGLLLGLLILARPDGVLLAGILIAVRLYKKRKLPWMEIAGLLLVLVPWLFFSTIYFHSVVPHTLQAKIAQGASGLWSGPISFFGGFIHSLQLYFHEPVLAALILVFLAIPGGLTLLGIHSYFRWLPVWAAFHMGVYFLLGVPGYFWYFAPAFLVMDMAIGTGVLALSKFVQKKIPSTNKLIRNIGISAAAVAMTALLFMIVWNVSSTVLMDAPERIGTYREIGRWINSNTRPEVTVSSVEVGALGYFSERRILCPYGLVSNPEVAKYLKIGTSLDWLGLLKPDILILRQKMWDRNEAPLVDQEKLETRYRTIKTFGSLVLYERIDEKPISTD